MLIEKQYKKKNVDAQQSIKNEIEMIKKGMSEKNIVQLNEILVELKKMLNNKCLQLSYPRIIIDSWDFKDELGIKLLDLAELYKRLK